MDVEKFIDLVYAHKCVWDQSDSSYHLRDVQRKAWGEISEEMDISVDELKRKWRGLRDTFGKELKKVTNKKSGQAAEEEPNSKWPYFQLLLFLRSTMSRREHKSSVPDTMCPIEISDGESSDYVPPSPKISEEQEQTPRKMSKSPKKVKRRKTDEFDNKLLQIEEQKLKYFQESANDPDAQFLMSLLPFLKDVPKHRKLLVRSKLQQVLKDEQNTILSPVLFDNSDSSQCNVNYGVPQNNSIQGHSQQSFSILPQQLSDGTLTQYVMQFNPTNN